MAGGAIIMPSRNAGKGGFRSLLPQREHVWPFALVSSLFFLWGFAYGLLDVLNKKFQNNLELTKLESTGLQVMYFGLGYFAFSPVAAEVMRRTSYKKTIIMGLALYSIGAVFFWPVAKFSGQTTHKAAFGGFLVCTGVIACGLATLEVSANSYITLLGNRSGAAFRLQFAQSWNGIASFVGPLIASKYFFSGEHADSLTTVQFVYLAVALMGACVAVLFIVTRLPEVSEDALQAELEATEGGEADKVFWANKRPIFGFIAQFMYVGSQVANGALFINYAHEVYGADDSKASQLLSAALGIFTAGRFIGSALLTVASAPLLLGIFGVAAAVLQVAVSTSRGTGGLACLMLTFFFMSIMYPIIFVLGTSNLGRHTRRAAGLLVMGVAGGAVYPPMQAAIADARGTHVSFAINIPSFVYIAAFALAIWFKEGMNFRKAADINVDLPRTESIEDGVVKSPADKIEIEEIDYVHR